MPRIPLRTAPTVGLQPVAGGGPQFTGGSGLGRLGSGIAEGAQGLGQLGGAIAEAQRRAEDAAEMEASAQLETYATSLYDDDENGLVNKHGRDAFEATDQVLGKLEKERQRLMQGMPAGARARFDLRTRSLVEQRRRQGERHAAAQRLVVEKVAVDNRLKAALTTIGQTDDPEVRARSIAVGLDALHAFESDPDLREQATGKWMEDAHGAAITRMLSLGQADAARSYFEEHRSELGDAASRFASRIAKVGAASAGERYALQFTEMAREKNGRVTEEQARRFLDTIDDVTARDQASKRLEHRLKAEDDAWKTRGADLKKAILRGYNQTGRFDADLMARLNEDWSDLATELVNLDDRRRARWRRSTADQRREIKEDNDRAMNAYLRLPIEDRVKLDVEAEFGARAGNDIGLGDIAALQTKEKAAVAKGESTQVDDFVREGMARGFAVPAPNVKSEETKKREDALKADLTKAWYRKPPKSEKEKRELQDEVVLQHVEGIGRLEVQAESGARALSAPVPPVAQAGGPGRTPVRYDRNVSRGVRRAVYSDGTFGPEEPIR